MQEDTKISKKDYLPCNFMVIRTNDRKNRIWERPKVEDILIEAKSEIEKYFPHFSKIFNIFFSLEQREITLEIPLDRLVEEK